MTLAFVTTERKVTWPAVALAGFAVSAVMACSSDDAGQPQAMQPPVNPAPEPRCGDGVVQDGEDCELRSGVAYCSSSCKIVGSCGDGIVNGAESCDVGSAGNSQEGCRACEVQPGYSCFGNPSLCTFGPDVPGYLPAAGLADHHVRAICEWHTAALGGAGKTYTCWSSVTDTIAVAPVEQCVRDFYGEGAEDCDATVEEFIGCWRPLIVTPPDDLCIATRDVLNPCMEKACMDFVPCSEGPGCIASVCKTNTDCSKGTHCSRPDGGWCECDVPGKSWCQPPKCDDMSDCTSFGASRCQANGFCAPA